ncbi:MAG TPA: hypothetical protein VMW19_04730 [Myxococcota bacterium]|nr:hypothetical protein [Myxococcota bacterium]
MQVAEIQNPRTADGRRAGEVLLEVLGKQGGADTFSFQIDPRTGVVSIRCDQNLRAQELIREAVARESLPVIVYDRIAVARVHHPAWAEGSRARGILQTVLTQGLGGAFVGIDPSFGYVVVDRDQADHARELIREAIAREQLQVDVYP